MTPAQEEALLAATVAGLDAELREAQREVVELIRSGVAPRDAVQTVIATFSGVMADTMAVALGAILGASVGSEAVLALEVGTIQLSRRLYAQADAVSQEVQGVVTRHARGFTDARTLALELFEGYSFRPPDAEPLQLDASNPRLPQYLREALLPDDSVAAAMRREFARLQVSNLSTPALQAAYRQVLDAIDVMEATGEGAELLEKRIDVAFFERMRYFASRIARTELHRAYADREALLLMADADVEFVQIRRAPGRQAPCICYLFAGRNLYGLGQGVYPKAVAPKPPFHPFCMCVTSPRLDLTGRKPEERDANGDRYFLNGLNGPLAARVMGSQAKRDAVLRGLTPEQVVNSGRDPMYHVQTIGG
jgi:hypothetical protein